VKKFMALTVLSALTACSTPERDRLAEQYPTCVDNVLLSQDILNPYEQVCINNIEKVKEQEALLAQSKKREAEQWKAIQEKDRERELYLQSPEGKKEIADIRNNCNYVINQYETKRKSHNPTFAVVDRLEGFWKKEDVRYFCFANVKYETATHPKFESLTFIYNKDNGLYDVTKAN